MNQIVKKYYKLISNKYITLFLSASFALGLLTLAFFPRTSVLLFSPVALFTMSYLIIMMLSTSKVILSKERINILNSTYFYPKSNMSIKELSRLLKIKPHTAYAFASLMERSGYLDFKYLSQGRVTDSKPKSSYSILVEFQEN